MNTRGRLSLCVVLAATATALGVVTLIEPTWIESAIGIDPDKGSGGLEWLVVAASLVASVCLWSAVALQLRPDGKS